MSKGDWMRPPSAEVARKMQEERIAEFLEIKKKNPDALKVTNERKIDTVLGIPDHEVETFKKSLKPLGYYNISSLLDERRLKYGIPNEAFEGQPLFDRVYIYQISDANGQDTYIKGGTILMSDHAIKARKEITPRGVLVNAGLKALDALRSNGVELGHIVKFQKLAPFMLQLNTTLSIPIMLTVCRDGDLVESEDLGQDLYINRNSSIVNIDDNGSYDHRIKTSDGNITGKKVNEYYDGSY